MKNMKILFLRGAVPTDRDPNEIVFNKIEDVDDVWTQLIFAMTESEDQTELWYWGGNRTKQFTGNFIERWIPSFSDNNLPNFEPDIIFCRGGFPEYDIILNKFENSYAYKIYYGAGKRYLPQTKFTNYNLILQDSPEQLKECRKKFPNIRSELFIKPAPDNIFYSREVKKEYDICFPANATQKFKGHDFVYGTKPKELSLLNLGNSSASFKFPENVVSYRVLKSQMPDHICKCKMGIVVVDNQYDSCPRVIPEMIACGIPIVILDSVRFWKDKYIVSGITGELATKNNFWEVVRKVLNNNDQYNPLKYYSWNLSMRVAARHIRNLIKE